MPDAKPKSKAKNTNELWYTEVPQDVRDSFVKIGDRRLLIIGFGAKRASQFKEHPKNWRKHPPKQQSAVEGSLNSLGWIQFALENKRTGNLIDGHERVLNALRHGDGYVPYIHVDLSEAEEAQALLSLDAIAALAETDQDNVDKLLEQIETDDQDVLLFLEEMGSDGMDGVQGFEQTEQLTPYTMARVLISFPIDAAVFVTDLVDQIQLIEGVEVDYGAN